MDFLRITRTAKGDKNSEWAAEDQEDKDAVLHSHNNNTNKNRL